MTAEIVSVGTELLLGQIVDTHASTMARILAECGIACKHRQTVGDNWERLLEALKLALSRADVVIAIGGLGPTEDDLTRQAIAAVLEDEMVEEPSVSAQLKRFFEERGLGWKYSQIRQAMRPASCRLIKNPNGTAPGLLCEKGGRTIIALPGPRGEFNPMADGPVREHLASLTGGEVIHSRVLRVCGIGESQVEAQISDVLGSDNPTVAPYAHVGEVHLRVTARAATTSEAERMIEPVELRIRDALGQAVYGCDDTTLEAAVVQLLSDRDETVGTAESITGGGLGQRLTSVPGAGDAFLGGFITYSVCEKEQILGIEPDLLKEHGPVSEPTARRMAELARERLTSTYALSLTGNAGPNSDVDDKPVGLVFVGLAGPDGTVVERHQFRGTREDVRRRASQAALVLLRNRLLKG